MAGDGGKCPKCAEGAPEYMLTYGDMVTLLLTFFVTMFSTAEVDGNELRMILSPFTGLGTRAGGNTLQAGKMVELGNTVLSLPSMEKGRALDKARKLAVSQFNPEIESKKVRIKEDERGLIISLASDAFFKPGSAEVDIEETRTFLQRLSALLSSAEMEGRTFRIEGHTDDLPTDPGGPWETNWELSAARSINVLHYLVDFGVREQQFQVAGFADTVPLYDNDSEEHRAYNRRVDLVILLEGHK